MRLRALTTTYYFGCCTSLPKCFSLFCNVRPICRTVTDAVHLLDAIVGSDPLDKVTKTASKFIPKGGYKQVLRASGLKGKRLGIVMKHSSRFDRYIKTLR